MSMTEQEPELISVPAAEDMDRETFCKHITARHNEKLGDLKSLKPLFVSGYVEDLWRSFHRQLHNLRLQKNIDHNHLPPKGRRRAN